MNPTARVEYALRADELLTEPQVRQIMEYYLAVRMRRYGRAFQPAESAPSRSGAPEPTARWVAPACARPADGRRSRQRRRRSVCGIGPSARSHAARAPRTPGRY